MVSDLYFHVGVQVSFSIPAVQHWQWTVNKENPREKTVFHAFMRRKRESYNFDVVIDLHDPCCKASRVGTGK